MEGFKVFFALDVKLPGSSSAHLPSLKGSHILGIPIETVVVQSLWFKCNLKVPNSEMHTVLCDRIFKVNGKGPALKNDY